MLTVYDDVDALVLDPVADEPALLGPDAGGVDAELEFDVTGEADAFTAP